MERNYFLTHEVGQYRSYLFEELVFSLLKKMYPENQIARNLLLYTNNQSSTEIDFVIETGQDEYIFVDSKAPYTDTPSHGINSLFRRIRSNIEVLLEEEIVTLQEVTIVITEDLPKNSKKEFEKFSNFLETHNIKLNFWFGQKLIDLFNEHFRFNLTSFSLEEIVRVKELIDTDQNSPEPNEDELFISKSELEAGTYSNCIFVCADFCSYTRFVNETGSEHQLISSIMQRFYSEIRIILREYSANFYNFTGDGVLFFWIPKDSGLREKQISKINECISRLVGMSIDIANDWQEHLDSYISDKGMKFGSAFGEILLFYEDHQDQTTLHAVGDCINLSSRLQSTASPNYLIISNRLRNRFFGENDDYEDMNPLDLHNFGKIKAWKKNLSPLTS